MKKKYFNASLFILIILITAFVGQFIGQKIMHNKMLPSHEETSDWHMVIHNELNLTPAQIAQIEPIEKQFKQNKIVLSKQMHVANTQLADALKADKSYSESVQKAIEKIHHVMGEMQKQTIQHLLKVQQFLTTEQNNKLEQLVTNALYQNTGR